MEIMKKRNKNFAGKLVSTSLPAGELLRLANRIASQIKRRYFPSTSQDDIASEIICYVIENKNMGIEELELTKLFSVGIKEARKQVRASCEELKGQFPIIAPQKDDDAWEKFINFVPTHHRKIVADIIQNVRYGFTIQQAVSKISIKNKYKKSYLQKLFYLYLKKFKAANTR